MITKFFCNFLASIRKALHCNPGYGAWFRREVQKGLDDLAAGRVVSHEEVKERIRRLGIRVD